MPRSTRLSALCMLFVAIVAVALTGCGGSSSSNLTNNPFAGSFVGSFRSTYAANSTGALSLNISSTGVTTGQSNGIDGSTSTIAGTIDNSGNATLTSVNSGASSAVTGTVSLNSAGQLVGNFSNGGNTITSLLSTTTSPLEYAGSYTGTFANSDGNTGAVTLTISSAGALTGSVTGAGATITGTVSNQGVTAATLMAGGASIPSNGIAAFDSTGKLIVVLINSAKQTTTVTLTKS